MTIMSTLFLIPDIRKIMSNLVIGYIKCSGCRLILFFFNFFNEPKKGREVTM